MHPLLVTASKEKEISKERYKVESFFSRDSFFPFNSIDC